MTPRPRTDLNVDQMHAQALELQALLDAPRLDETAVATGLAGLASKHEGLQVLGARLLLRCGVPAAVPSLREVVERQQRRPLSDSPLRQAAFSALAASVSAKDAPWILDWCFDLMQRPHSDGMSLVRRMPVEALRERLRRECASESAYRRRVATELVLRFPPEERRPFLKLLRADRDPEVQRLLREHL